MQTSLCKTIVDDTGRELLDHGTALFPIAVYHDDLTVEEVPWHWHDECEAILVTEGTAVVMADQMRVTLRRGDGCFINANVLHGVCNEENGRSCRLHSLVFHPRLVGGSAESVYWHKYVLPVTENPAFRMAVFRAGEEDAPIACIARTWDACSEEPPGFELLARNELSRLMFALHRHLPEASVVRSGKAMRDEERMKQMLTYIRTHLAQSLTVQEIAAAAAVSESECIRCFRKMIGTTPIRYVIQLRLQRAASLLLETDERVADIGAACGFQEMGYFARSFRRLYGVTPTAYRGAAGEQLNNSI